MTLPTICLRRQVQAVGVRVAATVAWRGERDRTHAHLRPFLLLAQERHDGLAATDLEHLLGAHRQVAGQRLLASCEALRLMTREADGRYRLTADGAVAIATGEVLVPDARVWTFWMAEDPLLPSPLLDARPAHSSSSKEDLRATRPRTGPVPAMIRGLRQVTTACVSGRRFRVDELPELGEPHEARLMLTWELSPDAPGRLRVTGPLGGADFDVPLSAPPIDHETIWHALLSASGLLTDWDATRGALRTAFPESDAEREQMARDLQLWTPKFDPFGTFDTLTAQVPLRARTATDARTWSRWRLERLVTAYATREAYEAWRREAVTPFQEHALDSQHLPDRAALAREVLEAASPRMWSWSSSGSDVRASTRYWRLQAPEDWDV